MARLPIPQQTVMPQQGRSPRRASAQDFGGDMNLGQLGQALQSAGGALQARKDRQDEYEAQKIYNEESLNAVVSLEQIENNAPLGAAGHTENVNKFSDDRKSAALERAQEAGLSGKAQAKLALKMDGLKSRNQNQAIRFSATSYGQKVKVDVEHSVDGYSQTVSKNPDAYQTAVDEQNELIDAIPDIDAVQKSKLKEYSNSRISMAAGLGLARKDPNFVISHLGSGQEAVQGAPSDASTASYINKTIGVESGGNPTAKASTSSATGLGQFTKGTWDALRRKYPNAGLTANGRTDPTQSKIALRLFTEDNRKILVSRGIPTTHANLYAMHFLGGGDAPRVLLSSNDTPLSAVVSPASMKANPFLQGMSVGQFKAWAARKMSGAGAGGSSAAKTGKVNHPVLDALSASERERVLNEARKTAAQYAALRKSDLNTQVENATAAWMTGQDFTGPEPTLEDFVDANPSDPEQAQIDYDMFQEVKEVGKAIQEFKTLPSKDIQARLDVLKPGDTSDPNYADQLKLHEVASRAAKEVVKQRAEDPAAYALSAFPYIKDKYQVIEDADNPLAKRAATAEALNNMSDVYDMLEIPDAKRDLLPASSVENALDTFNDTNLPTDQRVAAFAGMILSTSDPDQQRQLFEQFVRADSSFAKYEAAIEAQARGDTGAARRLFQAGMFDPEKLPGSVDAKAADINETINELITAEGEIGDAVYGVHANIVGNEERARRDAALMGDAIRHAMRSGKSLDEAVKLVRRDIYGDVKVINVVSDTAIGEYFYGADIVAAVPSGTDEGLFRRGAQAHMPQIREAFMSAVAPVPDDAAPEDIGPLSRRHEQDLRYVEEVLDEGQWRAFGNKYVFVDTASGMAASINGLPLAFSLEEILEKGSE